MGILANDMAWFLLLVVALDAATHAVALALSAWLLASGRGETRPARWLARFAWTWGTVLPAMASFPVRRILHDLGGFEPWTASLASFAWTVAQWWVMDAAHKKLLALIKERCVEQQG